MQPKTAPRIRVLRTPGLQRRHPIETKEYAIYTPPMDEMIETIGDWIDACVSGGYVYGPSRYGKSRAVKWFVKRRLEERFSRRIPLVIWVRRDSQVTERQFWNELLEASKFEFFDPLKLKDKTTARFLFMQQLITLARSARSNYIVLIIDEAHDVTLSEWKWLMGLQNKLDADGFRLSVFSIGSHQVSFVPDFLARTGNAHIAARFFAFSTRYHGLGSVEQLRYVFNGYDEDSEWPTDSGISYLQHYAPDSFADGRRLVDCTNVMWDAFLDLLPKFPESKKGKWKVELPMEHVARTAEGLLKRLATGERWDDVVSKKSLLIEIAKTGFTDHVKRIRTKTG